MQKSINAAVAAVAFTGLLGGVAHAGGLGSIVSNAVSTVTETVTTVTSPPSSPSPSSPPSSGPSNPVNNVVNTVTTVVNSVTDDDGLVDLDASDDNRIGVNGVATVTFGTGNQNGKSIGVTVLGGNGRDNVTVPVAGGIGIDLPGAGQGGGVVRPRILVTVPNGTPVNRRVASTGSEVLDVRSLPTRLKTLANIFKKRAWLTFAVGNAVCPANYEIASVSNFIGDSDWDDLQGLINYYTNDILTLRAGLDACRSVKDAHADHAVGLHIKNGRPILIVM